MHPVLLYTAMETLTEQDAANPVSDYGQSKLDACFFENLIVMFHNSMRMVTPMVDSITGQVHP